MHLNLQFSMPNVQEFPLFCDIPYEIKIITTTAPMNAAKAAAHPADKPVFPSPPSRPTDVNLKLCSRVFLRARSFTAMGDTDDMYILGEGRASSKTRATVETYERVWTPLKTREEKKESGGPDERGVWVQKIKFSAKIRLSVPPSFATRLIHSEVSISFLRMSL